MENVLMIINFESWISLVRDFNTILFDNFVDGNSMSKSRKAKLV